MTTFLSSLTFLLFSISLILLIIGLIKPSVVIRWGKIKTRKRVLLFFGLPLLISFIIFGIIGGQIEQQQEEQQQKKEEIEEESVPPISGPESEPAPEATVRLVEEGSINVSFMYGIDPIDFDEKTSEAIVSVDLDKLTALTEKHILEIPKGTKALLLKEERVLPADPTKGRNWPVYYEKVKILDGPHKDKIGWVAKSHIKFY